MPINSFCQKKKKKNKQKNKQKKNLTGEEDKLKEELKGTFPEVFSGGVGRCKKMSAKFELKPYI